MPHRQAPFLLFLSTMRVGGSEKKTVLIANELWSKGHPVHVAYLNGPDTLVPLLNPEIPLTCLGRKGKYDPRAFFRLRRYVKENSITMILCINLYPILYAMPLAALARGASLKCLVSINTTDFNSTKSERKMMIYAPMLQRADKLIFGCQHQMDLWTRKYELARSRSLYIHNGVDTGRFSWSAFSQLQSSAREALGLPQDRPIIGSVGQLRPEKQYQDVLSACARLKSSGHAISAILVGEGVERERLLRLSREYGIEDDVYFLGELADVRQALVAIDIFVLTSTAVETFSNAALEAMAMSRPVVLSDIGGSHEMVEDGIDGRIYSSGNVDELVIALTPLIYDTHARQRMGDEARRSVEERFTFARMVGDYEELLYPGATG